MNISAYRSLTNEEKELLTWLLEHGTEETKTFIPQLEILEARSSCICGCPSIKFNVPLDAPYISKPQAMRLHFSGESGDHQVGLILTAGNGVLSELEVFAYDYHEHPFCLPAISSLSVE